MIKLLNYFIAFVWLVNGLLCKVLNLVPRHRLIVSKIFGNEYAVFLTRLIGVFEILMAVWIISFIKPRICAMAQITIIAAMNIIEFIKVPGLLLFGRMNILFAFIFILLIYINAFVIKGHQNNKSMLSFLKDHPFAVEAFFESSLVLTFAVPKEEIQSLLPECLELDTFKDEWAFIAMALVKTKSLRPKGFPKFMGNDFYLIGYRIFVKYTNNAGKRLRGLYILKSETDKNKMEFLGNIFTKYKYTTTDITEEKSANIISISSVKSNFKIEISINNDNISLPEGSPFADWKEARRFAGPLPFTFSYNAKTKEVLIIQGVREDWVPKPVNVLSHNIAFIRNLQLQNIKLANAFAITNIPYYWKKGKVEKWNS